jgi:hypothetical protein
MGGRSGNRTNEITSWSNNHALAVAVTATHRYWVLQNAKNSLIKSSSVEKETILELDISFITYMKAERPQPAVVTVALDLLFRETTADADSSAAKVPT